MAYTIGPSIDIVFSYGYLRHERHVVGY